MFGTNSPLQRTSTQGNFVLTAEQRGLNTRLQLLQGKGNVAFYAARPVWAGSQRRTETSRTRNATAAAERGRNGLLLPSLLLTLNQAPFPSGMLRASPGKVFCCWPLPARNPPDPWCEGMCPWTTSWKPAPCSPWAYTLASRFISSRLPLTNAGGCSAALQERQTDWLLMDK